MGTEAYELQTVRHRDAAFQGKPPIGCKQGVRACLFGGGDVLTACQLGGCPALGMLEYGLFVADN